MKILSRSPIEPGWSAEIHHINSPLYMIVFKGPVFKGPEFTYHYFINFNTMTLNGASLTIEGEKYESNTYILVHQAIIKEAHEHYISSLLEATLLNH